MDKTQAIELINGIIKSDEKWKAFDEFVDGQVNKDEGILKKSVTKGLILEAIGHEVENYREETVTKVIKDLDEEKQRYVGRRFKSIKSLISQAYNKAPKSKGDEKKKRPTMTVNLPNDNKVDLNTYEGFKSLMEYRLAGLSISQLSEIESIVKEAINNSDKANKIEEFRKMDKEVTPNAAH